MVWGFRGLGFKFLEGCVCKVSQGAHPVSEAFWVGFPKGFSKRLRIGLEAYKGWFLGF